MFYWGLMLFYVVGVRILAQFQGSEVRTRVQSNILSFGFVYGVNQEN